jgi:hypothetical protein
VNCYPVLESGHFWVQDFYFRKFFRALGLKYTYINPSSTLARAEDGIGESSEFLYLQCEESKNYVGKALSLIRKDIQHKNLSSVCLFFPWLPQFTNEELREFSTLSLITKLSIAGVSVRTSSAIWEGSSEIETFIHQNLFSSSPFELLWIGESVPPYLGDSKSIRYLPEYAETKIEVEKPKDFNLGFFGMLSPYRGLFEILVIALFNPQIKIKVKGYSFAMHRIWRPVKYRFLRYSGWRENVLFSLFFSFISIMIGMLRYLPNIDFSEKPFPSEVELDEAIGSCKTILYCPKLRHGSGLMTKSLSAGVPVLWNGLPGQAYDFLNLNYPEGNFQYWEIFVPGRISKKLQLLPSLEAHESSMWEKVFEELSILRKFV